MKDLSVLLKKYSVPALFLIVGLVMLIIGLQTDQSAVYTIATLMMFVSGVLSLLYSSGKLQTKLINIIGIVAGLLAVVALWISATSVNSEINYQEEVRVCVSKSEMNLRDIRSAQKAHAETFGLYAATWEELIDFIKNGKVAFVEVEGQVPSRKISPEERKMLYGDNRAIDVNMTQGEAYLLSKMDVVVPDLQNFRRDTVMVPFMQTKFATMSYLQARAKDGFGSFYADSLPLIPNSGGKKWNMEVADSVKMGEVVFPAIYVHGKLPYEKRGEGFMEMSFGKLTTNDTGGSWEQ
jgi:Ca2+/Na+ antiporter